MLGMERTVHGRAGQIAILSGLALAAVGTATAVAYFTGHGAFNGVLLGALCATAFGAIGLAIRAGRQTNRLAAETAVLSQALDALSRRVLAIEALAAGSERRTDAGLRTTLQEVTGEVGLLSGLVRDLAVTIAAHDQELDGLRDQAGSRAPASPAPVVSAPARPALEGSPPLAVRPVPNPAPTAKPSTDPLGLGPLVATRDPTPSVGGTEARRAIQIREALAAERLELHLQPIVTLPQRKVRFYEALARLRLEDGSLLVPAEFLPVLERCGLAAELDRKVVLRAAAIARHLVSHGSETAVSVNLSAASLAAPGFLRNVGRIAELYPDLAGRLILEVSQRCWRTLDAETAGALAGLHSGGIPFTLDRASDLRLDPIALAERGVRYVKLPADMLLRPEGRLDIAAADLTTVLGRAGIRLVAERVEREEDVPDLIDLDVPLAQGFLFAAPRPVRPEALAPKEASSVPSEPVPESASPPQPEAEEGPQKRPFRAFLRRAS